MLAKATQPVSCGVLERSVYTKINLVYVRNLRMAMITVSKSGNWFNKERFSVHLYLLLLFCFDELRQNTVYLEGFVVKTRNLLSQGISKEEV